MNRLLLATCAVAAFAVTWSRLQHDAPALVRERPATEPVADVSKGPEPIAAPARAPVANLDELILALDSDLGEEGLPVDRQAIEQALRADPELRQALGLP